MEAYMFAGGVNRIYPIGKSETAYELKRQHPDWILAGERYGKVLPGFDTGNAPSELYKLNLQNKTVVHTTSSGTQGVDNAKHAEEILGCSLVNAKATAEYIKRSKKEQISLVCMGWASVEETEEDTLCAEYIKALLENRHMDMDIEIEKLKKTSGAHFFDKNQQAIFPEKDFYMCTEIDKFGFIMKLNKDVEGLPYIEKIDI